MGTCALRRYSDVSKRDRACKMAASPVSPPLRRYYRHGIRVFWLDGSEPEYYDMPAWGKLAGKDAKFKAGRFSEIGQLFTW
jgi:hypothetical protein